MYTCESESEVAQSCLTLRDPMDCSLLGPSVYGIFQARILEWVAISYIYMYLKLFCQKNTQINPKLSNIFKIIVLHTQKC